MLHPLPSGSTCLRTQEPVGKLELAACGPFCAWLSQCTSGAVLTIKPIRLRRTSPSLPGEEMARSGADDGIFRQAPGEGHAAAAALGHKPDSQEVHPHREMTDRTDAIASLPDIASSEKEVVQVTGTDGGDPEVSAEVTGSWQKLPIGDKNRQDSQGDMGTPKSRKPHSSAEKQGSMTSGRSDSNRRRPAWEEPGSHCRRRSEAQCLKYLSVTSGFRKASHSIVFFCI